MTEPLRLDAFHLDGLLGLVRAGQLTAEQARGHCRPELAWSAAWSTRAP